MPRIEAAVRSHPGYIRENNEDNFYMRGVYMRAEERNVGGLFKGVYEDKRQMYAVCDGMGGLDQGELASLLAVSNMDRLLDTGFRAIPNALRKYIDEISSDLQYQCSGAHSSGCTLAAVYLDGALAVTANLGDSRVYFKRGAIPLVQVTEDHSQAVWYLKQGILTPQEAETHRSRNTLRRYVGAHSQEGRTPDISKATRIKRGDVFLICSDGLSNMMSASEMDGEISKGQGCADICRALTALALKRGADDNITVMTLRIC
ncbi:MAG: protein phosphatase 2C domain-containing protein [Oscillospiraceae bacterium]|nr:protein phosphatase 2C domain-containing protein [Oscillospiraceae bacterium]